METYLLTWNPKRWYWEDLQDCIKTVKKEGCYSSNWSCGCNKKIKTGDRLFMIRLGEEPRGIFASGWAESDFYEGEHWNPESEKAALYIDIRLDVLLDVEHEPIFPRTQLKSMFPNMHWDAQSSGTTIRPEVTVKLESEWTRFLATRGIVQPSAPDRGTLLEEEEDIWRELSSDRAELRKLANVITNSVSTTKIEDNNISPEEEDFPEGKVLYRLHRTRERNRELVKKAKDKRKKEAGVLKCDVCQFNFFEKYGDIGADYIECHHTKPVSELEDSDKTQLKDIALVCANCHRMLHRKRPWLSIEQLKGLLKSR